MLAVLGKRQADHFNAGLKYATLHFHADDGAPNNNAWIALLGYSLYVLLQMFVPYRRYAKVLKWLTLVLLSYVALVFMVKSASGPRP